MSFFENTRKPVGFGGKIMVAMMNSGHGAMADWGFGHLAIPKDATVLDVGCGGGANIKKLLQKCPKGFVKSIDYSEISVEKSRKVNAKAIRLGRCEVLQASVAQLPFAEVTFDLVTAFETIYFWRGLRTASGKYIVSSNPAEPSSSATNPTAKPPRTISGWKKSAA